MTGPRACDQGNPRCRRLVAPGYNPLRLCAPYRATYRERLDVTTPAEDDGPTCPPLAFHEALVDVAARPRTAEG